MNTSGGKRNSRVFRCRGLALDYSRQRYIAGILNVTPDSFSDGGRYLHVEAAMQRAKDMVSSGARIIDIGGVSSRPRGTVYGQGAAPVSAEEEMARVLPVITRVGEQLPDTIISVDTHHPAVADVALAAGAHMINDITGLRYYPAMADVVASYDASLVVMHSVGRPGAMPHVQAHDDVVDKVCRSLQASVHIADRAGVKNVIVDPGFGFGKTPKDNLRLINGLDRIASLGRPVMVGISRKSTIGRVLSRNGAAASIQDRLFGSLGATAVAVMRGAHLARTHDVRATCEMIKVMEITMNLE